MISIISIGATAILVRNRARMARLIDLGPELLEATDVVYEATRQWYDAQGGGSWPQLAESTIARKASQGLSDPARPLYAEGNLYESVTSASGPYSYRHQPGRNSVVIGVDWTEDNWQIPVVLHGGDAHIPARPIWPAHSSPEYADMRERIREKLVRGL